MDYDIGKEIEYLAAHCPYDFATCKYVYMAHGYKKAKELIKIASYNGLSAYQLNGMSALCSREELESCIIEIQEFIKTKNTSGKAGKLPRKFRNGWK
ncbi:MAG TPA: hypothetical protein VFD03_05880 [Clostridia bacterium]|nr:hypothetical protein [Clostridia bacterium]